MTTATRGTTTAEQVDEIIWRAAQKCRQKPQLDEVEKWTRYERYKQLLTAINLSASEYEAAIRKLTKALGL